MIRGFSRDIYSEIENPPSSQEQLKIEVGGATLHI